MKRKLKQIHAKIYLKTNIGIISVYSKYSGLYWIFFSNLKFIVNTKWSFYCSISIWDFYVTCGHAGVVRKVCHAMRGEGGLAELWQFCVTEVWKFLLNRVKWTPYYLSDHARRPLVGPLSVMYCHLLHSVFLPVLQM